MTKVSFILSIVVMGVACFFAYQNNRAFATARDLKASTHRTIKSELVGVNQLVADISAKNGEITAVQKDADTEEERLKAHTVKISQLDSEAKRTSEDTDSKNKKLEELKAQLAKLPADVKPETLSEDLNKLKQAIAESQAGAEAKKKLVEAELVKVEAAERDRAEVTRKIDERKKSFDRNGLTARVVAVNNDWGFVVIDAGKSTGITEDTKLLVTRGTQTVGKLSIMAVEGNRTVANILTDTLADGILPAPGDRVILENLVQ
jgi:cell shape-determining protein MreC